ncbi:hypothetical protein [Caldithrix abyssi]|uniref:Uncharacterized protein n=1 Tax=Caldithrix abyssi DSM 13497 TaxID=880073 RepID=A0A1J1C4S8_CALAY|nr:hypothetical protein [Caldithrix abyssi]APF17574.1 hypothetical protein Cabys_823 [Caldithrix abyssi DSM 13497]
MLSVAEATVGYEGAFFDGATTFYFAQGRVSISLPERSRREHFFCEDPPNLRGKRITIQNLFAVDLIIDF